MCEPDSRVNIWGVFFPVSLKSMKILAFVGLLVIPRSPVVGAGGSGGALAGRKFIVVYLKMWGFILAESQALIWILCVPGVKFASMGVMLSVNPVLSPSFSPPNAAVETTFPFDRTSIFMWLVGEEITRAAPLNTGVIVSLSGNSVNWISLGAMVSI